MELIDEMIMAGVYPDGIGQNIDSAFFYHGTNDDGRVRFEKQGYLGHNYHGSIGLWITSDLHHACGFGAHIYRIGCVGIDETLMDWHHADDGIFYSGKINFDYCCITDNGQDVDFNRVSLYMTDYNAIL